MQDSARPAWLAVLGALFALAAAPSVAAAAAIHPHVEVDPLPFALGGYGVQVGVAHDALPGWRLGLGNFSLDVPDFLAQLNSANDGFHIHVRRSHALYILRCFSGLQGGSGPRGLCVGGSLRYLRLDYTHDDVPGGHRRLGELSVEAIAGYKWHPFQAGFYLMPWLAIAKPITRTRDPRVGTHTYQPDFVGLFATMNIGWQF